MTTALVLAETADTAAGNPIVSLIPFLLIGLVFYALIIRPQRKRQQEQQKLLSTLSVGDEVITIGGFHGEIIAVTDETVDLEIARDVVVTLARNAVSRTVHEAPVPPDDDPDFGDIGDTGDEGSR